MAAYTQTTDSSLTRKMWDKVLHEQVQDKSFFKGMIGKDKGGEGSIDEQVSNFPIVEKTQLGKEAGDRITIGLVKQLVQGDTKNAGKTGNSVLVDAESSMTFHYVNAILDHYRNGVLIEGKMTEQRSPYDLQKTASQLLSTHLAKQLDDSLFFSMYSGYSPNVIREGGATSVAHPNIITALGGAVVDATEFNTLSPAGEMNLTADSLDLLATICAENNINPIIVDGEPHFMLVVHPRSAKTLRGDSDWVNAQYYSAESGGKKNPLFTGQLGMWGGIVVKESNKIAQLGNYTSGAGKLTVASKQITVVADGFTTNTTEANFRMNILLGANSIARAFGVESYMARRKEDDYGNRIGFGGGYIYGDRRADFTLDEGATTKNQSSLIFVTKAPSVSSVSVW